MHHCLWFKVAEDCEIGNPTSDQSTVLRIWGITEQDDQDLVGGDQEGGKKIPENHSTDALKSIKYFSKGYLRGHQDGKDDVLDYDFTAAACCWKSHKRVAARKTLKSASSSTI